MAVLPAAVDPNNMGLNITPYDEDDTSAAGTTTLRHIDQSTRLAWSTFGSVQSDPYKWGHATLPGYTPPAGRPTTPPAPNVSNPNLNGIDSPQTIAQSARNGVPISGRVPAPASRGITVNSAVLKTGAVEIDIDAAGPGTLHAFLYDGEKGYTPVFNSSCPASGTAARCGRPLPPRLVATGVARSLRRVNAEAPIAAGFARRAPDVTGPANGARSRSANCPCAGPRRCTEPRRMVKLIHDRGERAPHASGSLGFRSVAHRSVRFFQGFQGLAVKVNRSTVDICGGERPHNMNGVEVSL